MPNRKKILHIISGLNRGGAETALFRLVENQNAQNIRTYLLVLSNSKGMDKEFIDAGVHVQSIDMMNFVAFPLNIIKIVFYVLKLKPDVIQTWMFHADFLSVFIKPFYRKKIIWNIRQTTIEDCGLVIFLLGRVINPVLSYIIPNRIICCSKATKYLYAKKYLYCKKKLIYIPNGFNVPEIISDEVKNISKGLFGIPGESMVVGVLGRFHPMKDYLCFILAMAQVQLIKPSVWIVFAGDGLNADNPQLIGWVSSAGLNQNQCLFLGYQKDPINFYKMVDIFCSSSYSEGFPNVIAEAQLYGVPVVATDVGDTKYIVGESRFIVPARNPFGLASAIISLLTMNKLERLRLGREARDFIIRNYSLESYRKRYFSLY